MSEDSHWLTTKEAASYLRVSQMTLFRWVKSGKLNSYKLGNAVRFTKEDLEAVAKPSLKKEADRDVDGQQETVKKRAGSECCLMCGHEQLIEGHVQSTGRVAFQPLKTKFWTLQESSVKVVARMCSKCGFMHMFADQEKMETLQP
jgi:excisionase family DNA binding protein